MAVYKDSVLVVGARRWLVIGVPGLLCFGVVCAVSGGCLQGFLALGLLGVFGVRASVAGHIVFPGAW